MNNNYYSTTIKLKDDPNMKTYKERTLIKLKPLYTSPEEREKEAEQSHTQNVLRDETDYYSKTTQHSTFHSNKSDKTKTSSPAISSLGIPYTCTFHRQ